MTMDVHTYRDGRKSSTAAAEATREALAALGLPESVWGNVRPRVIHSGEPYVHLGMVRADVAKGMAGAIADSGRGRRVGHGNPAVRRVSLQP
ncbi:hypothetical protein [Streptomyces griseosporeus]|uniref:hypothetical protein n=1 Tax=Streptomyces griseosporeus TaxID=1910 RepID=UPI003788868E